MSEQILSQILNEIITVNQRLDRIESEQTSFKQNVNQRFDDIDQRFESVDQRFLSIDQRFDRIESEQMSFKQTVNQRFDDVDQRFDRTESNQKTLRDELRDFREETRANLQVLKAGQQGIRTIEILNRRQLKLEADVEQLKNR